MTGYIQLPNVPPSAATVEVTSTGQGVELALQAGGSITVRMSPATARHLAMRLVAAAELEPQEGAPDAAD